MADEASEFSKISALACDCHVHLFGPADRYPYAPDRFYTPGDADEGGLLAMHRRLGIGRVVIIQASPQGTDNTRLIDGLKRLGETARGVAVVDATIKEAQLNDLHKAGVRGVRVNIATKGVKDPVDALRLLEHQARRVSHLGWHVQIYTTAEVIETLSDRLATLTTPLVIDHFGLDDMSGDIDKPGFLVLLRLVRSGRVFVKLSAIERKAGVGQLDRAIPFIRALVNANPDALVWGSDWPHTGGGRETKREVEDIEPFRAVEDGAALGILLKAVPDPLIRRRILVETPACLYDFPA